MNKFIASFAIAALLAACSPTAAPITETPALSADQLAAADAQAANEAAVHAAHDAYVAAINANDVERVAAVLTDDVVYQAPHEPEIAGKDAVTAWVKAYFDAYSTKWEKTTLELVVTGQWAFERYAYKATDTPKAGGPAIEDKGKGINIYHLDYDSAWRLARDSWSSDLPIPAK